MNKCSLLFSLILLFGSLSFSYAQKVEGEIILGPSLTSLRGNDVVKQVYNPTINFSGGIGINYQLKTNTFLNARLLYDKKGAATGYQNLYDGPDPNSKDGKANFLIRYNYITLPIQYKYRLGRKIQYEFGFGMYGSFLVSHYSIEKVKGSSTYSGSRENDSEDYKRYDLGLAGGFSVLIPLQKSFSINLGIHDNFGLTNTIKHPVKQDWAIRNNSLTILVGVNYKFGKD